MRTRRFIAALAGLLAVAGPALAQNYPAEQSIMLPDVEVRSGPSKVYFATSKLKQGDKVVVLRANKDPNWLEIKPPADSFSWINAKYVKQIDATHGFVDCDPTKPAPILPGSKIVDQPPNSEGLKLTAGTVVVLIARPLGVQGETWLPIAPHPSEVRYIPAEAVSPAKVVVAQQVGSTNWTLGAGVFTTDPNFAAAEKLYAAGDYAKARPLYQQVVNTTTDTNLKILAMNKLASMPQAGTTPAQTASRTAMSPGTPNANLMKLKEPAWTQYGRLYETKLTGDAGQPLYAMDVGGGQTIYVSTDSSKSLKGYVNRTISVYGPTMYRADSAVRLPYVVATHVAVP
jgi:uncharacterized protein YgiM (DUF1202 family)